MLTPEINRWQMALQWSNPTTAKLQCSSEYDIDRLFKGAQAEAYGDSDPQYYGRCCLGVALHAAGIDERDLVRNGMPAGLVIGSTSIKATSKAVNDALPYDECLQRALAGMNDNGVPHRVIAQIVVDCTMTGDWTEVFDLTKRKDTYYVTNGVVG